MLNAIPEGRARGREGVVLGDGGSEIINIMFDTRCIIH